MKKIILLLFLAFIILPSYSNIKEQNINISLNEDQTADWVVRVDYKNNITKSTYYILSSISDLKVFSNLNSNSKSNETPINCFLTKRQIGVEIICNDIDTNSITYKFRTFSVQNLQNFFTLRYRFYVTENIDSLIIKIRLPLGTALLEPSKLSETGLKPFEPDFGKQGSDGRHIFVQWQMEPKLGDDYDIHLIYEKLTVQDTLNTLLVPIASVFSIFVVIIIFYIYIRRKSTVKNILPILTDNERKVMQIVLQKKQADQRTIVKETDFSKAKTSRIITNLIDRGIIEKTPKGRTNIIKLKQQNKDAKDNVKK